MCCEWISHISNIEFVWWIMVWIAKAHDLLDWTELCKWSDCSNRRLTKCLSAFNGFSSLCKSVTAKVIKWVSRRHNRSVYFLTNALLLALLFVSLWLISSWRVCTVIEGLIILHFFTWHENWAWICLWWCLRIVSRWASSWIIEFIHSKRKLILASIVESKMWIVRKVGVKNDLLD